jgi:repressor LexA
MAFIGASVRGFTEAIDHICGRKSIVSSAFTDKQGQYLAFIHAYTKINRQPPAESDFQRFFQVTPPSVHRMVLELESKGLISRTPRQSRSIQLLVSPEQLPILR